jgi:malate/lactate dehydrogenase
VGKLLLGFNPVEELSIYSPGLGAGENGYLEELSHINRRGSKIKVLPAVEFLAESEILIFCAGYDYSRLEKRRAIRGQWQVHARELAYNLAVIRGILEALRGIKEKTLLIYTNPVDIISYLVFRGLDPSNRVLGFGVNLDTLRLRSLVDPAGVVIGAHGNTMVPVGISRDKAGIIAAREKVLLSISRVTSWQGYTWLGPESASSELFEALLLERSADIPLSVYHEQEEIFIGQLVEFRGDRIHTRSLALNGAEEELFRESVEQIKGDLKRVGA